MNLISATYRGLTSACSSAMLPMATLLRWAVEVCPEMKSESSREVSSNLRIRLRVRVGVVIFVLLSPTTDGTEALTNVYTAWVWLIVLRVFETVCMAGRRCVAELWSICALALHSTPQTHGL